MDQEEFTQGKQEAPFNMAIATLEALRLILSHIEQLDLYPLTDENKQKIKINLVKRFYVDASPLLDKNVKKFKNILKLQPKDLEIIKDGKATGRKKISYDEELDIDLNQHLIDMQVALQGEGFYMPPKKNLGSAVGRFR